jgi:hypothetical protein
VHFVRKPHLPLVDEPLLLCGHCCLCADLRFQVADGDVGLNIYRERCTADGLLDDQPKRHDTLLQEHSKGCASAALQVKRAQLTSMRYQLLLRCACA